jgi:hypothetical protein
MKFQIHRVVQGLVRILAVRVGLEVVETPVNSPEVEEWIGSGELDLDESEFRTVTLH